MEKFRAPWERHAAGDGVPWSRIARHILGLRNGQPGARRWRQVWSDHRLKGLPAADVARRAADALGTAAAHAGQAERAGV